MGQSRRTQNIRWLINTQMTKSIFWQVTIVYNDGLLSQLFQRVKIPRRLYSYKVHSVYRLSQLFRSWKLSTGFRTFMWTISEAARLCSTTEALSSPYCDRPCRVRRGKCTLFRRDCLNKNLANLGCGLPKSRKSPWTRKLPASGALQSQSQSL